MANEDDQDLIELFEHKNFGNKNPLNFCRVYAVVIAQLNR